jgi:precorrin-4/cobalt-precorrin-4 C11-methyltransferase
MLLKKAGISYSQIPGVTAAMAAAAALNLELTLPETTQSLIITRASGRTQVPKGEDLSTLAAHRASLALYLSAEQGREVSKILAQNYGPLSPVVILYRVSWPDEKIIWTEARQLAETLEKEKLRRHCLILAGPTLAALMEGREVAKSKLYDAGFSHLMRQSQSSAQEKNEAAYIQTQPLPGLAERVEPKGKSLDNIVTALYALTEPGARLALKITQALPAKLFLPNRLTHLSTEAAAFETLGAIIKDNFHSFRAHVFIAATGLVVRLIGPLMEDKRSDPAVVCLGQDGQNVISLLSGHLGGANQLAKEIASITMGRAIINTATDITSVPALETVARDLGLKEESLKPLAAVSRALCEGQPVEILDPYGFLLPALTKWPDSFIAINKAPVSGPFVVVDFNELNYPPQALIFRPPALALGLGCHKGLDCAELEELALEVLKTNRLSLKSIKLLATIDSRGGQEAPAKLAQKWNLPLLTFDKNELSKVKVPNPSQIVQKNAGVPSVCEAAAILAAKGGQLLTTKTKSARATCATALINYQS